MSRRTRSGGAPSDPSTGALDEGEADDVDGAATDEHAPPPVAAEALALADGATGATDPKAPPAPGAVLCRVTGTLEWNGVTFAHGSVHAFPEALVAEAPGALTRVE